MGGEFQVSASPTHDAAYPSVTTLASGGFVVVWQSYQQDGSGAGVYARQYDPLGVAIDGEIRINSFVTGDQSDASLAANAAGDFVVTWEIAAQTSGSWGIYAQRFLQTACPCRRYPWSRTSPSWKAMWATRAWSLPPRSHSPAKRR